MTPNATTGPQPQHAQHIELAPQPGSQALFIACPIYEALYEGTRGPGKTWALLMDFAQHVGQGYGPHWRGILFRRTYKQLDDIVNKSTIFFRQVFPRARLVDYEWRFPDGERLLLRYMDNPKDYWNYHGHEYPWIGWEELTNWPNLDCYDAMKACSRSAHKGMPRKYRGNCNPYGVGHNAVKLRFIDPAPAGVPVADEQGSLRVRLHGHYSENRALMDADPDYEKRLLADSNEARRKAWAEGDWDIVAGGMFDDVWRRAVHVIKPFAIPRTWKIDRAFDWGSSKPFAVQWWAESDGTQAPNGRIYPRGTLFLIGQWYGWDGKNPNVGIKLSAEKIGEGIVTREKRAGIRERVKAGPADSAIWVAEPGEVSIGDKIASKGATFERADKRPGSRKTGWEIVRGLLLASLAKPMEAPGIFIFETCTQFIRTVPTLPRDEKDPDDVDTDAEDHDADALRYRATAPKREWRQGTFTQSR